jgi:hypothetical protein
MEDGIKGKKAGAAREVYSKWGYSSPEPAVMSATMPFEGQNISTRRVIIANDFCEKRKRTWVAEGFVPPPRLRP